MIHIEMYDSRMFCGDSDVTPDHISQSEWHDRARSTHLGASPGMYLARVTCEECLRRVASLGSAASTQLARVLALGFTDPYDDRTPWPHPSEDLE